MVNGKDSFFRDCRDRKADMTRVPDVLHTIDYGVPEERYPVFRTCEREHGKVVFQMVG